MINGFVALINSGRRLSHELRMIDRTRMYRLDSLTRDDLKNCDE